MGIDTVVVADAMEMVQRRSRSFENRPARLPTLPVDRLIRPRVDWNQTSNGSVEFGGRQMPDGFSFHGFFVLWVCVLCVKKCCRLAHFVGVGSTRTQMGQRLSYVVSKSQVRPS